MLMNFLSLFFFIYFAIARKVLSEASGREGRTRKENVGEKGKTFVLYNERWEKFFSISTFFYLAVRENFLQIDIMLSSVPPCNCFTNWRRVRRRGAKFDCIRCVYFKT